MGEFSGPIWAVLAIVAFAGVVGILHSMAAAARNEIYLHDLRLQVKRLRAEQLERLKRLAENAGRPAPHASQPAPHASQTAEPQQHRKAA